MSTAPNPDRCEPPEEMRRVVGWHWIGHKNGDERLLQWHASPWEEWLFDRRGYHPAILAHMGYHYIAPVTLHSEVAALRAEVERLRANNDRLRLAMQEALDQLREHGWGSATLFVALHATDDAALGGTP